MIRWSRHGGDYQRAVVCCDECPAEAIEVERRSTGCAADAALRRAREHGWDRAYVHHLPVDVCPECAAAMPVPARRAS